jgi:predicted ATPase/Tfp pilus assembly protein PilF
MAVGPLLRSRRRAAGLTQEELAERSSLSARTISDLERGVYRTARKDTARLLVDGLGLAGAAREEFLAAAGGRQQMVASEGYSRVPTPPVPLIGRQHLVGTICALLRRPEPGLLSLVGPGGVGKTRLAVEVAAVLSAEWPEPPSFVSLDAVGDPELVVSTVGRAIGVRDGPEEPLDAVVRALEGRRPLLVVDNFEHLVEAAPVLEAIIEDCPRAAVLVTSRTPLRVRAERVLDVPPLPVPGEGEAAAEELLRCPSVQLFSERCLAAGVEVSSTPGRLAVVGQLCRALDGLPLALELAAARARLLGVEGLRAQLDHRLDLLTAGPRDLPERQRTLRATIDWGHSLLSEPARELLRRLAVFAGGFTLEATAVVADRPSAATVDQLAELLDASLVGRGGPDGPGVRFQLLQIVRDFALERLAEDPVGDEVHARHARYFATLARQAESGLQGSDQGRWLQTLDLERDNLRAALQTTVARQDVETALRLAAGLWRYWEMRGDLVEGRHWLTRVLALPGGQAMARAEALKAAGNLARNQADHAAAQRRYAEALALFTSADSDRDVAACLNNLGNVGLDRGDRAAATTHYAQALELARGQDDGALIALVEHNLALALVPTEPHGALRLLTGSLARQESLGDARAAARTRASMGLAFLAMGDVQRAAENQRAAVETQAPSGDRVGLSRSLEGLAASAAAAGQLRRAAGLLGAAEVIREHIGLPVTDDDPAYHQAVEAVRAGLDPATCAAAWAEGRARGFQPWIDAGSKRM